MSGGEVLPPASLSDPPSRNPARTANPMLISEADYLNVHPVEQSTISRYVPGSKIIDTSHYYTTVTESWSDRIGSAAAHAAVGAFVSAGERLDPGITPGAEAAKYGINSWIDGDVEARSISTAWQTSTQEVPITGHYEYTSTGSPQPTNPYNS